MSNDHRLVAGRYRLAERLGSGGMGVVWLAHDERLRRTVAVKHLLLPAELTGSEAAGAKRKAMREGRIAARLQHPHAIMVYDVAEDDGQTFLIMEYLPSKSLSEVLTERGTLPPDEVAPIGAKVAAALASAHAAGIVHRDVKPANVLLGDHDRVKITDFGISRAVEDVTATATGIVAGTPAFLSPEVAKGEKATFASDVFSLGSTLYSAIEGVPPFGIGDNAIAQLYRVSSGQINPPTRTGPLTDVILELLHADPDQRPTMSQASEALTSVAARLSSTGDGQLPPSRSQPPPYAPALFAPTPPTPAPPTPAPSPSAPSPSAPSPSAPSSPAPSPSPAPAAAPDVAAPPSPVSSYPAPPAAERPAPAPPTEAPPTEARFTPSLHTDASSTAISPADPSPAAAPPSAASPAEAPLAPTPPTDASQAVAPHAAASSAEASSAPTRSPAASPAPAPSSEAPSSPSDQQDSDEPTDAEPTVRIGAAPAPAPAPARQDPRPDSGRSGAEKRRRAERVAVLAAAVIAVLTVVSALLVLLNRGDPDGTPAAPPLTPGGPPDQTSSQVQQTPSQASPTSTVSPTPTGTPPPAPPVNPPAGLPDTPEALQRAITGYYALMPGNLPEGWSRLTPRYQQSPAGGYSGYQRFWNQMRSVRVSDVTAGPGRMVDATIEYTFKTGKVVEERHSYWLVAQQGRWMIDRSTVISSVTR